MSEVVVESSPTIVTTDVIAPGELDKQIRDQLETARDIVLERMQKRKDKSKKAHDFVTKALESKVVNETNPGPALGAVKEVATNVWNATGKEPMEGSATMLHAFDEITNVHPYLKIAVLPFKLMISLELKRRANMEIIAALEVLMRDMMSVLIPLKTLKDPHHKATLSGTEDTIQKRLETILPEVAADIIECGVYCEAYEKKSLACKLFKSYDYEAIFTAVGEGLKERRATLQLIVQVHTAVANQTQNVIIEDKIDLLLLFKELESPRLRELRKQIEKYPGGAAAILKNDRDLAEFAQKAERIEQDRFPVQGVTKYASGEKKGDAQRAEALRKEISRGLGKHLDDFVTKIGAQHKELLAAVDSIGQSIQMYGEKALEGIGDLKQTLSHGAHRHIDDLEMHWRNTVKARLFTLTLRDYILERHWEPQPISPATTATIAPGNPSQENIGGHHMLPLPASESSTPTIPCEFSDAPMVKDWDLRTIQPISEAFDDDATGFITPMEVNRFMKLKPDYMSFFDWLMYWGKGYHNMLRKYRQKIGAVVQQMFHDWEMILPENRTIVDQYFLDSTMQKTELILREIDLTNPLHIEVNEQGHFDRYDQEQEETLDTRLGRIKYHLDSIETLENVKKHGRIERTLLTLLYLVLHHHARIIRLAGSKILHPDTLERATHTLFIILEAVASRADGLLVALQQAPLDKGVRFSTYSFGLFRNFPVKRTKLDDVEHDTFVESFLETGVAPPVGDIDDESFLRTIKLLSSPEEPSSTSPIASVQESDHLQPPISGQWSTVCSYFGGFQLGIIRGVMEINLNTVQDSEEVSGSATCSVADGTIEGSVQQCGDQILLKLHIKAQMVPWISLDPVDWTFKGELGSEGTLNGKWDWDQIISEEISMERCSGATYVTKQGLGGGFDADRFIQYHFAHAYIWRHCSPAPVLDDNEEDRRLALSITPSLARNHFYKVLLRLRSLTLHNMTICDECGKTIAGSRLWCMQCTLPDLSDQVGLCRLHINATPSHDSFTHELSHTLIRIDHALHNKDKKYLFDIAKVAFNRVKQLKKQGQFRTTIDWDPSVGLASKVMAEIQSLAESPPVIQNQEVEAEKTISQVERSPDSEVQSNDANDKEDKKDKSETTEETPLSGSAENFEETANIKVKAEPEKKFPAFPKCQTCSKEVQLPCWYCANCYQLHPSGDLDEDQFLCEHCEPGEKHKRHSWIFVRPEMVESQRKNESTEGRLKAVEDKLDNWDRRMKSVEEKLEKLLQHMGLGA